MSAFDYLVWVIPVLVAVCAVWRPWWGLAVLAASLALFGSPPGGPYLAALDVAALAALALSLCRRGAGSVTSFWPSGALVLVSLASLVPLTYHPPSWQPHILLGLLRVFPGVESWSALYTWRAAVTLVIGWLLFLAVRRSFEATRVRLLGLGLAFGVAVVSVLGLLEQLHAVDLGGYRAIGELVPTSRMHSLFFNSGWFAEFLILATPFAVASLVVAGRKAAAGVLAILALLCMVLSEQRGAWFAALIVIAAFFWHERMALRRGTWRLVGLLLVVFVLGLGSVLLFRPDVRRPLAARAEVAAGDLAGRTQLWRAALQLSADRPLLGQGVGSFAPAYDALYPPGSPEAHRPRGTAHNWLLNVLAERGLLGVLALLTFALAVVGRLRRALQHGEGEIRLLGLGLAASFLGAVVYGAVQYVPFLKNLDWLLWILTGAAFCLAPMEESSRLRRTGQVLCIVALILVPFRALLLAPPRWRGDASYGLHEPEVNVGESFQWAEPESALRVPWRGRCLAIMVANGHRLGAAHPVIVRLSAADVERTVTVSDGWREIVLPVGQAEATHLVLHLVSDTAFRPFADYRRRDLPPSADIRRLSVAVRAPTWVECPAGSPKREE